MSRGDEDPWLERIKKPEIHSGVAIAGFAFGLLAILLFMTAVIMVAAQSEELFADETAEGIVAVTIALLAFVCAIVGFTLSTVALSQGTSRRALSIAGLIMSILLILLFGCSSLLALG